MSDIKTAKEMFEQQIKDIVVLQNNLCNFVAFREQIKNANKEVLQEWDILFEDRYQEIERDHKILSSRINKYIKKLTTLKNRRRISLQDFINIVPSIVDMRVDLSESMFCVREKYMTFLADLLDAHIKQSKWPNKN